MKRIRLKLPAFFFLIAIVAVGLAVWYANHRFESNVWKSVSGRVDATRLRMVDDLLWRYELKGKSRAEIDDLLGQPEPTAYFSSFDYVYWLGPERGFLSIDSEWLCIQFEDDIVCDVRINRD